MTQTCFDHLNDKFDDCIDSEVSTYMKKIYNCMPPHFPYDGKTLINNSKVATESECKLNNFTNAELVEYRDKFLGKAY
jgi:hypothetical protein